MGLYCPSVGVAATLTGGCCFSPRRGDGLNADLHKRHSLSAVRHMEEALGQQRAVNLQSPAGPVMGKDPELWQSRLADVIGTNWKKSVCQV